MNISLAWRPMLLYLIIQSGSACICSEIGVKVAYIARFLGPCYSLNLSGLALVVKLSIEMAINWMEGWLYFQSWNSDLLAELKVSLRAAIPCHGLTEICSRRSYVRTWCAALFGSNTYIIPSRGHTVHLIRDEGQASWRLKMTKVKRLSCLLTKRYRLRQGLAS